MIPIIKSFFDLAFWGSIRNWIFFILWVIQFTSLFFIYKTARLNQNNKKIFSNFMNDLYKGKEYETLIKIIGDNIEKIIEFQTRQSKIDSFFSKYKGKINIEGKEDFIFLITNNKRKRYQKIFFPIMLSLRKFFSKNYDFTSYLADSLIAKKIFNQQETLWYKIIELWKSITDDNNIKTFVRYFLKISLRDKDSLLSQAMWWLDYEPVEVDNELILLLQIIWKWIDYGKIIDETIHNLINDNENRILLNIWYDSWSEEYYEKNSNIVTHIRHLMRTYRLIWQELDLWNMPMFIIKELIEITERSKYQDNYYEYTTASYYLMSEYFDEIEYLCDNIDTKYLGIYFAMIWQLLSSDKVVNRVKESIISSTYWFLCNSKNKEEKKNGLVKLFSNYNNIKEYFQLSAHERITHNLDAINQDIYDICKKETNREE